MPPIPFARRPLIEELEPRLLFSADLVPFLAEGFTPQAEQRIIGSDGEFADASDNQQQAQHARLEVVFIDLRVQGYDKILADIQARNTDGHSIEVVLLDSERDGLVQIGEFLSQRQDIDAIHLISHGSAGSVQLGSNELNFDSLLANASAIKQWGNALSAVADILIYGCDLASTEEGQSLVDALGSLTGADVAASDDLTGSAALGGDWVLEYRTGAIETPIAVGASLQQNWAHTLAVAVDATSTGTGTGSSITVSHTTSGSQRLMLVGISMANPGTDTVSSVTWNGRELTRVEVAAIGSGSDEARVEVWHLLAPQTGNANLVVNFTGAISSGATVGVTTFTGVDQTTPIPNSNSNTGTSSTASVSVASTTDDLVFSAVSFESPVDYNLTPGGSQTERWDLYRTNANGGGSTQTGATSTSVSWGNGGTSSTWALAAVSVRAAVTTANNDTASTPMNTQVIINVAGNDIDPQGDTLTVLDLSKPSHGTATSSGGNITYTPTTSYTGSDSLTYRLTDGNEGLTHYWKLDGSGTDSIGSSNGTLNGGPTTTTGRFGDALQFDESNDYVLLPDLTYGTSFTLSFDFNLSDNSGSNYQYIYSHGNVNTANNLNVYFGEASLGSGANVLRTSVMDSNDAATVMDVDAVALGLIDGNWHTYTLTVSSTGGAVVYLDGVARVSNANVAKDGVNPTGSAYLGGRNDLNIDRFYGGKLDSVALYNSALSATEVAARAAGGRLVGTLDLMVAGAASANTVPGAQTTNEDTARVFSSGNGNQISIADSDAGGANNQITLSVSNGTLTLAGTAGLSFVSGDGTADATMTFRGTASAINTALNGLSYSPTANWNGIDTLTVATKDSVLLSLDIDANLKGRYTFENTGALGADTSPAAGSAGTPTNASAVVDSTRGNVLSLAGNGYIETTGHFANPTNVTLAAWVNLTSADTFGADVISLGDSLAIRLDQTDVEGVIGFYYDGTTWHNLDSGRFLAGTGWHHVAYTFSDTDNAHKLYIDGVEVASATASTSISYTLGENSYIGKHANGLTTWDFNGLIDDARVYSRVLTASEIATLATDLAMTDTDTVAVTVAPVADAPVNTVTSAQNTNEDTALVFSSGNGNQIAITDADAGSNPIEVTVTVTNGTLTLSGISGLTFTAGDGTTDSTMTFRGTVANINTALNGLAYIPANNYNGSSTLTISSRDNTLVALDIDTNLQVRYTFDGNANDIAPGTAQDGILKGNATVVNDALRGQVLSLDGADDYVDLNSHTTTFGTYSQGTFAAWIKTTATGYSTIFDIGDGAAGRNYVTFYVDNGQLNLEVVDETVIELKTYSTASVNDGNWHHVAVTVNASGNQLYIDGVAASRTFVNGSATTNSFISSLNSRTSTRIGAYDNGAINGEFLGLMDDFRIYDRAITAAEVATLAAELSLTDTDTVAVTVNAVNDAPIINGLGGDARFFAEGGAPELAGSADYGITDVDSTNFDTGTLTVSFLFGNDASEDMLAIRNQGTGAGQIGVSGANITYAGTTIGTWAGASVGANLEITLNANANATSVKALINNITYSNIDTDNPTTGVRKLRWVLTDGDGGTSGNLDTTVTVTAVNDAPVLADTALSMTVLEDAGAPSGAVGTLVSALVGGITDVDSGALKGIAITTTDETRGTWYYSTNAGSTWTTVGAVDASNSLLLASDANTRVYFAPSANWNGTVSAGLTFRGWDQTSGAAASKVSTSSNGGTTAFSSATDTVAVTVAAVNDAPTFGIGDGIVTTSLSAGYDSGQSVTFQPDGKIIVAGASFNGSDDDFALVRYNADGSLDTAFGGGDGIATTDLSAGNDYGHSVTFQPDGKIVVAGESGNGGNTNFGLVRYNADGSLDTAFGGGDGIVTNALGASDGQANGVTLQPDGKIVVAGESYNGNEVDFALVRYNADGSLDMAFGGGDGIVTTALLGAGDDYGKSVTLQPDGKIVVAGASFNGNKFDFALVRYNADGSLDTAFGGGDGIATALGASDDDAYSVTLQPDGKIVVAGYSFNGSDGDFALVRYNADGSLDTAFGGGDGIVTTDLGAGNDYGRSVTFQPDGKIVVAGYSFNGSDGDFGLVRYNADGSLDTAFGGGDGIVTTALGAGEDEAYSVTLQPDGKIVVAGYSGNGSDTDFALVRYNADGSLDSRFDPASSLNGSPTFVEGGAAVVLDADVQVYDPELSAADNFSGAALTLARNGGAHAQDVFSATGTLGSISAASGNLVVGGTTVGAYTNGAGTLVLTFNANATNALVNEAMRQIAYSNSSDAPEASAQINWTFDDGNSGAQGTGGTLTAIGSTTVNITAVNDAPVLADTALSMTVLEDAGAPSGAVGTLVSALVGGITDVDSGALKGIAITTTDETRGTWYYSTNAGSTWTTVGAVDASNSLLLASDANTRVYFAPSANWNGTVSAGLTFRGWDQTSGAAASKVSTSSNGGTTAFSSATDTVDVTVTPVNDAPAGTDKTVTTNEDTAYTFTVADFGFTDPNDAPANALTAVKITTLPGAGTLTLNSVAVTAGQTVSVANINSGLLRFTPAANANGAGYTSFTFQVQDGGGTANGGVDLDASANTLTFNVSAVNDAPVASGTAGLAAVLEDTASPSGSTVASLFASNFSDPDITNASQNQLAGVAVRGQSVNSAQGRWQYSIDGGNNWVNFGALSDTNALTLRTTDLIRFRPTADYNGTPTNIAVRLIDNSVTVSGGATVNVSTNGTTTAYSASTVTLGTSVTAVNDEQVLATNTGATVAENSTGNVISAAMLATTDVDNSATQLVYTVTGVPTHGTLRLNGVALAASGTFTQADVNSGLLTYDHDGSETSTDSFTFTVDDGAGATSGGTFNLTITAVNDGTPSITSDGGGASANLSVAENTTAVTTVTATDTDLPAQTLTYSISGGADAGLFTVNSSTGALSFVSAPDRELATDAGGNHVYDVIVQVSDGTLTDTQAIAVTVTDVDEFDITAVVDTNATANTVNENAAIGTVVGITAFASDADATTNAITYSLDNDAGGRFAIDGSTGVVTVNAALDFESATSHSIVVRAVSADGSFATQGFTVSVADVNESGVTTLSDTNGGADFVLENAANGTTVGLTAFTQDPDGTDTVSYSLDDNAGGRFAIDANSGVITVAGAIDREAVGNYSITVRATSTDTSTTKQVFNIAIGDVDEFDITPVVDTNASANAVDENAAIGTVVGVTAFASDADATTNAITYSLTDSDGGRFAIDSTTGVVTVAGAIDREANGASRNITIRATSADTSFTEQGFSIGINDVDEFDVSLPIDTNTTANTVNENAANGSVVGITAFASDADATTNAVTYTLQDNAGGRFAIDSATGVVTVADGSLLDYETATSHTVTLRATSSDGSNITLTLSINVAPVNDNAPVITSDGGGATTTLDVAENTTAVTTMAASDADLPAQTLTYAITGGADAGLFSIDSVTGALSFSLPPDFEAPADSDLDNVYEVIVQVSDGLFSDTQTLAVKVTQANDNAPVNAPVILVPIAEDSDKRLITQTELLAGASDADGDSLTATSLVISSGSGALVDNGDGTWTYTPALDDDTSVSFSYTVTDGSLTTAGSATLDIASVNDAPVISVNTLSLLEGETVVLSSANLNSGDVEQGPAHLTYTVGNVTHGQFEWVAAPGTAITSFTQADIDAGLVVFAHDAGDFAPAYDVTVSDGALTDGPQAATINFTAVAEGINVSPASGPATTEAGGSVSFDVVLNAQPFSDVTIFIASGNPAEGTASLSSLTFTAANWNIVQKVTVTGVDDAVDDGDRNYAVQLQAAVSADRNYDALDPVDVALSNLDDDTAGVLVAPASGLVTDESGGSDTFSVVLTSQPLADVVIRFDSSNAAEGVLSNNSLVFTAGDWNIPRTVTATGVSDTLDDGNVAYQALAAPAASADPLYNGLIAGAVDIANLDTTDPVPTDLSAARNIEPDAATPQPDPATVPETRDNAAAREAESSSDTGRLLAMPAADVVDSRDNPLDTVLTSRIKTSTPPLMQNEALEREVLTNPDTQSNILLRLLEFIQASYALGDSGDSGDNAIASAVHVEITQDEAFRVDILSRGAQITAVSLSAGSVLWALRAGGLFTSLLTSLPAWRSFDVLPVLGRDEDEIDDAWELGDEPEDADADGAKNAKALPA